MSLSRTLYSHILVLALLTPLFSNAHRCTDEFLTEVNKSNITYKYCNTKTLKAEFGYNFNNKSRQLDIVFGARLEGDAGWLAWGMNPQGPHMIGTQALIGIKHRNGTVTHHKYNITAGVLRGCQLLPSDNIGLDVRNFNFVHMVNIGYYVIIATIFLPSEYNSSRANVVWQIGGDASSEGEPFMHPKSLKNFDAAEIIDLISNKVISFPAHQRRRLRTAHGILNIVGWGTFLPIGVIVARYFRNFPRKWSLWFVLHVGCQMTGYILGLIGWGTGLWLGNNSKYYKFTTHRNIAIIIFTFATIQMFSLRLKPKFSDEYRTYWNMYHHFLGYSLLAVMSVNIFEGIKILEPEHSWKWTYIGLLGLLGAVVLAFEVFTWTKFYIYGIQDKKKTSGSNDTNTSTAPSPGAQVSPTTSESQIVPKRTPTPGSNDTNTAVVQSTVSQVSDLPQPPNLR